MKHFRAYNIFTLPYSIHTENYFQIIILILIYNTLDLIEKKILNDLTQDLLVKLGNEDPKASIPRLFPEAILSQPDLDSEYRAMTAHQLENSHRKALEALNSLTSEKETSLDDLILVIKVLNIIRLELGEELDIDDGSQSPPADDSSHYRLSLIHI